MVVVMEAMEGRMNGVLKCIGDRLVLGAAVKGVRQVIKVGVMEDW